MEKLEVVIPGDKLSTAEEYFPSKNTMEINGNIVSLKAGKVIRDIKKLEIMVDDGKERISIKPGDIVYGQIVKSDQKQLLVRIVGLKQNDDIRYIEEEGFIRNYDGHLGTMIKIGDFIKGMIVRKSQNYEISLQGHEFGVIRSRCSRCRNILVLNGNSLYCKNCERSEMRKTSKDYGVL